MDTDEKNTEDSTENNEIKEEKRSPWRLGSIFSKKTVDAEGIQESAFDLEDEDEEDEELELCSEVLKEIKIVQPSEKVITDGEENDDPLDEAFDLESEEAHPEEQTVSRPKRYKISSAKEFFNTEVIYRYDLLEESEKEVIKGRYRIELKGFQGGIWTIDINAELHVSNRAEDADVVIGMQQNDFLDVVNGSLNPQLAILSQKIRVNGDIKKAVFFQSVLAPKF